MKKQVLAIVHDSDKRDSIKALCEALSITYSDLSVSDINKPLGEIIGLPTMAGQKERMIAPVLYSPPELLIFNALLDRDLDAFLDGYRLRNIPPIPLKGTVTPFNLSWTPYEIIKEYEGENKSLSQ